MIKVVSYGLVNHEDRDHSLVISHLLETLANHPLDRSFQNYGNFCYALDGPDGFEDEQARLAARGMFCFFGNFFDLSNVFCIHSDEPDVIRTISVAIFLNKQRLDYYAQDVPKPRPKSWNERH